MADKYATVAGAGGKDGTDWANAFGVTEWLADLTVSSSPGDFYYVEEGTYTLSENFVGSNDGTLGAPISVIGVLSGTSAEPPTYSNFATGANRPLVACTIYAFFCDNYWYWRNFRWITAHGVGVDVDTANTFINCFFHNNSGTANSNSFMAGGSNTYLNDCEFISDNGEGIYQAGNVTIINCYIHDCGTLGIFMGGGILTLSYSTIDTCGTDGVDLNNLSYNRLFNNNFYNCGVGVNGTTTALNVIVNNNFVSNTTGLSFTSALTHTQIDYNNYYGNGADVNNVTKGPNALAINPQFTNAAGGDFSLDSASELIGAGFGIRLGVGL